MSTANALPLWRKSSYSSNGSDCVEVAFVSGAVATRDTKNPGPVIAFDREPWRSFLGAISNDR